MLAVPSIKRPCRSPGTRPQGLMHPFVTRLWQINGIWYSHGCRKGCGLAIVVVPGKDGFPAMYGEKPAKKSMRLGSRTGLLENIKVIP